jgi:hypothetical protein
MRNKADAGPGAKTGDASGFGFLENEFAADVQKGGEFFCSEGTANTLESGRPGAIQRLRFALISSGQGNAGRYTCRLGYKAKRLFTLARRHFCDLTVELHGFRCRMDTFPVRSRFRVSGEPHSNGRVTAACSRCYHGMYRHNQNCFDFNNFAAIMVQEASKCR